MDQFYKLLEILGGPQVVLLGLAGAWWAFYTQRKLNALQNTQIAKNESRIHINKVQFENEVKYTVELWEKACAMEHLALVLTGLSEVTERFINDSCDGLTALRTTLHKCAPFVEKTIYAEADNYMSFYAAFFTEHFPTNNKKHSKDLPVAASDLKLVSMVFHKESAARLSELVKLIRDRFSKMTVIE